MLAKDTYNGLTMKGHVRTKQKCPKCTGKFGKGQGGLVCPKCLTTPNRFFVDFFWHGERIKIYKDSSGQVLDSYRRADRLLAHIRWEVDNQRFNLAKYQRAKFEPYQMTNFSKKWLKEVELRYNAGEVSYSTFDKYKKFVERFIVDFFTTEDVRTIDTLRVKQFNLCLAEQKVRSGNLMSAKYRQDIIGVLRIMYNDALKAGELTRVQVPVFPEVEVPETDFDILTEDEQDEVLAKIPSHDRPIYNFILWYGVRPSEGRALMRDSIIGDFEQVVIRRTFTRNNKLRENPKENKWRVISLLEETREILRSLEISLTGFVFVNKQNRPYSQSYLNDNWNKACDEAGFKYIPLYHASRHSLGTKLAQEGHGEDVIAKVLGHSDTKNTRKYTRYDAKSWKEYYQRRNVRKATVHKLSPGKKGFTKDK